MKIRSIIYICLLGSKIIESAEESWQDRFYQAKLPAALYAEKAAPLVNLITSNKADLTFTIRAKRELMGQKTLINLFNNHSEPSVIVEAVESYQRNSSSDSHCATTMSLFDMLRSEYTKATYQLFPARFELLTRDQPEIPVAIKAAVYVEESAMLACTVLARVHTKCKDLPAISFLAHEPLPPLSPSPRPFPTHKKEIAPEFAVDTK